MWYKQNIFKFKHPICQTSEYLILIIDIDYFLNVLANAEFHKFNYLYTIYNFLNVTFEFLIN